MRQTSLINTQTFVDYQNTCKDIAVNFFEKQTLVLSVKKVALDNLKVQAQELRDNNWSHYQNIGKILEINADSKNDFQTQINEVFKVYQEPVLLFLGDLSDYSIPLQESMLKLLEEPPINLFLIIFGRNTNNILGTILSRCTVVNLPSSYVLSNLENELLTSVKQKLPVVSEFAKLLASEYPENISLPDLREVERNELDFWLWQLNYYIEKLYLLKPNINIAKVILRLSQVRDFNNKNLQKKFGLAWLKVG